MNQTVHKYFQDGPNYSNTNNFCWNIKDMHMQAVVYSQTKMIWFVGDMICYHLQSNDMICRWPNLWQPGFVSRVVHLSYYHRQNFLKKGFMKKKNFLIKSLKLVVYSQTTNLLLPTKYRRFLDVLDFSQDICVDCCPYLENRSQFMWKKKHAYLHMRAKS